MKNLPLALILEKNKLSSADPWLMTLDITLPAPASTVLRLVNNTEDVTFGGNVYTRFPFKIDVIGEGENGELPQVKLMLSNVTRVLQAYLEELEGAVDSTALVRWINVAHLNENYADLELTFEILETVSVGQWISCTLGMPNLLRSDFPYESYHAGHCRFVRNFKDVECGYAGPSATCAGTLDYCRQLNNSRRFGGFPGLSGGGVRLA